MTEIAETHFSKEVNPDADKAFGADRGAMISPDVDRAFDKWDMLDAGPTELDR